MNRPAYRPNVAIFSRPSGIATRPSGAATQSQIAQSQAILAWLNHLPRSRSVITGVLNPQTTTAIRAFQDNYNRDPVVVARGFSPRPPIDVDGILGPQTIAALLNFNASAAAQGYGVGATPAEIAAVTAARPSIDAADALVKQSQNAPAPNPAAPLSSPAVLPPASTFPVVPVVAVSLGVLAIGGAFWYRSRRKGR